MEMKLSFKNVKGVLRTADGQQPCTVTASGGVTQHDGGLADLRRFIDWSGHGPRVTRHGGRPADLAFVLEADGQDLRVAVEGRSLLAFLDRAEEAIPDKAQIIRTDTFRMEGLLDGETPGHTIPVLYELTPPTNIHLLAFLFFELPEMGKLGIRLGDVSVLLQELKRWSQLPA